MKILKPKWVHHEGKAIFSIDIHPDGTRFATGGQGVDSGLIVIWNLAPLLSEAERQESSAPKVLCKIDDDLECINSVRWSRDGTTLASAGLDKIVKLWKLNNKSGSFESFGVKIHENWRCSKTLQGHSADIIDLAWSPHDKWLASCSVDNSIIVWDMCEKYSFVSVLKGHTGMVKGVTWDPVGKYLASQSDDKSVRIWRTSDWNCVSTITEPFEECGGTTHFLRLSWSPDGLYLVSAHAINNGWPTAQIIEREKWKCDKDYVGHRKAVTCVRFHPEILKNKNSVKGRFCCLAIGSRDSSISIWVTSMNRPHAVIHNLFEDSILDLSWRADKHVLLACSTDGTVACVIFSEEELGITLSQDEKSALYKRMYGEAANMDSNNLNSLNSIIEYADFLDTKEDHSTSVNENNNHVTNNVEMISPQRVINTDTLSSNVSISPSKAINKQIESRSSDGKRRITPIFCPKVQDRASIPIDIEISSSSMPISYLSIEPVTPNATVNTNGLASQSQAAFIAFQADELLAKRSILQENGSQLDSRLTKTAPAASTVSNQIVNTSISPPTSDDVQIRSTLSNAGKAIALKGTVSKSHGEYKVTIVNNTLNTSYGYLSKVICSCGTKKLWDIFTGFPVVSFNICAKYVMICCIDSTLQIIDLKNGTTHLPTLRLLTPAIHCVFSLNSELCGIVSECGQIRLWNLKEKKIFLSINCHDLLNTSTGNASYVTFFYVSEAGIVYILLSNDCSFSYSDKLGSWIPLNSRNPIVRHGIATLPQNNSKSVKSYPLGSIQSATLNKIPLKKNVIDVGDWENAAKLQFIENQIKICEEIHSPSELEYWYTILGTHLAQHGTETRVQNVLDELLGSGLKFASNTIPEKILGIEKHKLLKNVLKQLKTTTRWQRIYMEYSEQLNE